MSRSDGRRPSEGDPAATVERAFRDERPAVLAALIRHVGDVDDRLRLIFTCCHPELALPARVADPLVDQRALAGYQPLHAARAELLRRAGDHRGAADAYRRAIALSGNAVERAELDRRLAGL